MDGGGKGGELAELSLGTAEPSSETHIYHGDVYYLWQGWSSADFPAAEAKLQAAHNALRCCWVFSQWQPWECFSPSLFPIAAEPPCHRWPTLYRGLNLTDLTQHFPWINVSPSSYEFQILRPEVPIYFQDLHFLFFLTGIYFLKWNGQYLGVYIIHKTERKRKKTKTPTSCILLFYFIWGKMFYARPSESKTQSYYSTHGCFNHFSTNNGEKMWFYKQTGRKSLNTPRERV